MSRLESKLIVSIEDETGPGTRSIRANLKEVNQAASAFDRRAARMEATAARVKQVSERMSLVAPAIAAAAAGAIRKGFVDFAEIDRKMTRIGITAEASGEETKAAFTQIQQQAKTLALPLDQAMEAMDTLVASGMNMQEALAFLPSVLATTQASGAAAADIANAGLKAASAFKIEAKDMQNAFDAMAFSGKNGQFELRDMAQYVPSLASSFATLGYSGENGLKRLLAILQTIRAHTGSAEEAATDARNIFGKMMSQETIGRFKKLANINLPKELKKATANGEDLTDAFIRLTREAIHGDLTKLPLLFNDQELRMGMTALLQDTEELRRQLALLNSTKVNGTVGRDLERVADDAAASVERLKQSYDHLLQSLGQEVAPPLVKTMDVLSTGMDVDVAKKQGMEKLGWNWLRRQLGPVTREQWMDVLHAGGYADPKFQKAYERYQYEKGGHKAAAGSSAPGAPEAEQSHGYTIKNLPKTDAPIPQERPDPVLEKQQQYQDMRWRENQPTMDPRNPAAIMQDWQKATEGKNPLGEGPGEGGLFEGFDWEHFLFGKLADGKKLRDAMKMDLELPPSRVDTPQTPQTPRAAARPSGPQKVEITNPPQRPNVTIHVTAPVTVNEASNGASLAHDFATHLRNEISGLHADIDAPGGY